MKIAEDFGFWPRMLQLCVSCAVGLACYDVGICLGLRLEADD